MTGQVDSNRQSLGDSFKCVEMIHRVELHKQDWSVWLAGMCIAGVESVHMRESSSMEKQKAENQAQKLAKQIKRHSRL